MRRLFALINTRRASQQKPGAPLKRPTGGKRQRPGAPRSRPAAKASRSRLMQLARNGMGRIAQALGELSDQELAAFLNEPAAADTDVAQKIAAAAQALGLTDLTPADLSALATRLSPQTVKLIPAILSALGRAPQGTAAEIGVVPADVSEAYDKHKMVQAAVAEALRQLQEAVSATQTFLQAWQYEAQARTCGALLLALSDQTMPVAARRQLLLDAAGVLDAIGQVLAEAQRVRQHNQSSQAQHAGDVAQVQKELQLLQTLQDLRDDKPVDEVLLAEMAEFYTEYTGGAAGTVGADQGPPAAGGKPKKAPPPPGKGTVGKAKGGAPDKRLSSRG